MKKLVFIFLIISAGTVLGQDKGEVREIDGSFFKVHYVQQGETLFALSREYKVAVDELIKVNPRSEAGLDVGQEILIPVTEQPTSAGRVHKVMKGETLFSISKKYDLDIDEIKRLNGMDGVELREGQELILEESKAEEKSEAKEVIVVKDQASGGGRTHTVEAGETLYSITRRYNVTEEELKKLNNLSNSQLSIGQRLILPGGAEPVKEETTEAESPAEKEEEAVVEEPDVIVDTRPTTTDTFVETVESGVAELIPDTENTRKYLAMHRTVSPGTIIRVRNEMNGREVWARVIGKLPNTGENSNILVKISKAAYDRLGAVDKKFRVTITYIP